MQYSTWVQRWDKKATICVTLLVICAVLGFLCIVALTPHVFSYEQAARLSVYALIMLALALVIACIFLYGSYKDLMRWLSRLPLLLLFVACGGGGGGGSDSEAAEPSLPNTRTVCVAQGSEDLIPHVIQAVDAWNGWDTSPLSETCTEFVRCLPKAVAHEMGHALGILWHPETGLMATGTVRGPLMQLTIDDFMALPDDAPTLLYVDEEQPCDHEVGYGYPSEPVLSGEVAWYELRTRKIWIEPSPKWRN